MRRLVSLRIVGHKQTFTASSAWIARGFLERLGGLLVHPRLVERETLVIERCNCVHTFFMKYPIDVVFCSAQNTVVRIIRDLKPFRMSAMVRNASYVIELHASTALDGVNEGDHIEIEHSDSRI